jgi:regulator of replication initiation timing
MIRVSKWQAPRSPVNPSSAALDWALKHARVLGDTVFLPRSFEYEALEHDWNAVRGWLRTQDLREWTPRPLRRLLASKSAYSFRYVTQLDPLEYLAFTALIFEVGHLLEAIRVPKQQNVVFSWRFSPQADGQLFDPNYRWFHFNQRCEKLASEVRTKFVVVADIADFFQHIYLHPIERVLDRATCRHPAAYCILRFIRNWNAFVSYGVPVGLSGSRLIAEAVLSEVDKSLLGSGRKYCRYSDDIRIFCKSERDARRALEDLAMVLFETHGLTLQPMKTLIVSREEYLQRFSTTGERIELESLTDRLHDLLKQAGWEDDYEDEIILDNLPDDVRKEIDKLNIVQVLEEQIASPHPDTVILRFVLHRLRQLGISNAAGSVLKNMHRLQPAIDTLVEYLSSLRLEDQRLRYRVGRNVIATARKPSNGTYERMCLLSLFTRGREFDNEDRFEKLYEEFSDPATRREVVLALGRSHADHWFIARRRDYHTYDPWLRRAFIAAFSCVTEDAREPFYRSLRNGADVQEAAIIKWASAHPF